MTIQKGYGPMRHVPNKSHRYKPYTKASSEKKEMV